MMKDWESPDRVYDYTYNETLFYRVKKAAERSPGLFPYFVNTPFSSCSCLQPI
jgi:hypothetical protein